MLDQLGANLGHFAANLAPTWANLAQLGASLGQLGATFAQLGASLGQLLVYNKHFSSKRRIFLQKYACFVEEVAFVKENL